MILMEGLKFMMIQIYYLYLKIRNGKGKKGNKIQAACKNLNNHIKCPIILVYTESQPIPPAGSQYVNLAAYWLIPLLYQGQKWKSLTFECVSSSKLRQIIEQVIQITMNKQAQFTVKQIVWAKVSDYPWWPARIVKTDREPTETIYRVHFFGDPTYCYLKQTHLLGFQSGLVSLRQEFPNDFKLGKPVQLAKAAIQKSIRDLKTKELPKSTLECQQSNTNDFFEETKIETKLGIENLHKKSLKFQQTPSFPHFKISKIPDPSSITLHNVFDHVASLEYRQLSCRKRCVDRKQILTFQSTLKHKVLERYNLHNLCDIEHNRPLRRLKQRIIKNEKVSKRKCLGEKQKSVLMIRKLKSVIQKHLNGEQARAYGYKIGESLRKIGQKSHKHRLFKAIILWLNSTKCSQIGNYVSLIPCQETRKYEFEEKSKMTQIGSDQNAHIQA